MTGRERLCPCSQPADFEWLMAVEAGLEDPCRCEVWPCPETTDSPQLAWAVVRSGALALHRALLTGVPVTAQELLLDRACRSAPDELEVLQALAAAYRQDGDLAGARKVESEVEALKPATAAEGRAVEEREIVAATPSGLPDQLTASVSQAESACCQVGRWEPAPGEGPLGFCAPNAGSDEWTVWLRTSSPTGVVVVGPVAFSVEPTDRVSNSKPTDVAT